MATVKTIRVRQEWVRDLIKEHGSIPEIAELMELDKSTLYRWLSGEKEATPRFIGNVLLTFPIDFDEAFVAVEEVAERRRARVYTKATGRVAA